MASPSNRRERPYKLEIACFNTASALTAIAANVDRIELCGGPASSGGLTPSRADLELVKNAAGSTPVHAMIRPRAGDFVYTNQEIESMKASITEFGDLADGFVFGALNEDGQVYVRYCEELLKAVGMGKPCVFHRAVDETSNFKQSLDMISRLGFAGVLTSGSQPNALNGADVIGGAVSTHGEDLQIITGGGVRASNLADLVAGTKTTWYHSSALVDEGAVANAEEIGEMLKILDEARHVL